MHDWIAYSNGETLGLEGTQGGTIVFDDELPNYCRLTVEKMMKNADYTMILFRRLTHSHQ